MYFRALNFISSDCGKLFENFPEINFIFEECFIFATIV